MSKFVLHFIPCIPNMCITICVQLQVHVNNLFPHNAALQNAWQHILFNQKLEEQLNSDPNRLREFPSAVQENQLKACVMSAGLTLPSHRWQVKHWTCLTKISNSRILNSVENTHKGGIVKLK